MVVLDTTQKYLTYNEIRSLLSKYKDARKLQVQFGSNLVKLINSPVNK